jgi:predicted ATPase
MCINNPNLFVISGGPGSGKTTVLRELAKLGVPHAPEVARRIIQEQVEAGGTALPWNDREAYLDLMLQRSIESFVEHTPAVIPALSDGIPDALGYSRLIGLGDTEVIERACRRYRYAPLVFLAPPWKEIYATDTERKQDFAEAERTFAHVAGVYQECGYTLIEIPRRTPSERAQFILEQLLSQRPRGVDPAPEARPDQ